MKIFKSRFSLFILMWAPCSNYNCISLFVSLLNACLLLLTWARETMNMVVLHGYLHPWSALCLNSSGTNNQLKEWMNQIVAQSCPTLCDPINRSMPGLPVHHQLPKFTHIHVHWVSDAIQPSLLSCPSPPTCNLSQY